MAEANRESILDKKISLNNGQEMPAVGMGTFRIKSLDTMITVVDHALEAGYRLFDTAAVYHNETMLNKALVTNLPKHNLSREDVFIITKLSPHDNGNVDSVTSACEQSLKNLGLEYIDLYLVHFPGMSRIRSDDVRNSELRQITWKTMVKLYESGKVNSIGVSNFTIKHLSEVLSISPGFVPAVNQVEWHPYYYQDDLYDFCKSRDIVVQGYCSLGGSSIQNMNLINDSVVKKIALKHNVTAAQVLLRWSVQRGVVIIPKSTDPLHIKQNISLDFELSKNEMKALDGLGQTNIKYAWDPTNVA